MRKSKSQNRHPSLCPKPQKASTITIDSPTSPRLPIFNKNQRATHLSSASGSTLTIPPATLPPLPTSPGAAPNSDKKIKEEVRQNEYQQYTRKNYCRKPRVTEGNRQVDSQLVNRQTSRRQTDSADSRRCKSKSALNYAKYFIKQVSNIPTEPSSKEKNTSQQEQQPHNREVEATHIQPKEQRQQSRERSRKKQRNSIVDKLKSLKTVRSKSNRQGNSIDKELVLSLEKRSLQKRTNAQRSPSKKKIPGNIDNLVSNQALIARMKARSRNRRIVLKVKYLKDNSLQQSMNLMLNSILHRSQTDLTETLQKIELHLQLLNLLPSYVKQFKQIYQDVQCWDELLFLTYKKFYLQRIKIGQALYSSTPSNSPFNMPFTSIQTAQLKNFNQSLSGIRLQERIRNQNNKIQCALRQLYNHIIEKSGKYINLLQDDNFSQEIYWLMGEEVCLLRQEKGEICEKRIKLAIKCCYLIAFMNGQKVDIESVLTQPELTQDFLHTFQQFISSVSH